MKLGIMSDSHDNLPLITRAVEIFNNEEVEMVLHAGDFVSPFTADILKGLKAQFVGVFGNNDGDKLFLRRKFDDIGMIHEDYLETLLDNKNIALMHQPKFLEALAASSKYDLIVYGYTHEIDIRTGTPLIVNPGECGGWLTGSGTIVVVELDNMTPNIHIL